jgi:hypothetical protein
MDRHPAVTPQQLQMMLPPPMEIIITITLPEWNESQMIHFGRIFCKCATVDFAK